MLTYLPISFEMKSSHLSRSVFRAILAGRTYAVRDCQRALKRKPLSPTGRATPHFQQKRQFFGIAFGSGRIGFAGAQPTASNVEAALVILVDLVRARRSQSRTPLPNKIVDAFRFLFVSRIETPRRLTRNEVFLVTETFKYLQERGHILGPDEKTSLSQEDLFNVLRALESYTDRDRFRTDVQVLATYVFDALKDTSETQDNVSPPVEQARNTIPGSLLDTYITVLSKTGSAKDALDLLRKSTEASDRASLPMWTAVLKGLATEGRTQEFWKVIQEVQDGIGPLDAQAQETLISHFIQHNEISRAKEIFTLPLANGEVSTTSTLIKLVECAMRNGEEDLAATVVKMLQQRTDSADMAGTVLIWHVQNHQSSVTHLRQLMKQLTDRGVPDVMSIKTINRLVEHAFSQNKPGNVSQYLEMGRYLALIPNGETRALQLDYHTKQQDHKAAAQTYELLVREDVPADRSDVPVLNRYIAFLAFSPDPDYVHLMQIVDHVIQTNLDLDAEAIAGLCHVFLQRDEFEEAAGPPALPRRLISSSRPHAHRRRLPHLHH